MNNNSSAIKAILNIQKVKLEVKIGVTAEEKRLPQLLLVDVAINFNEIPKLAFTDNIADGLCYAAVVKKAREFSISREFNLVEHFAHSLAKSLCETFDISSLSLKVFKTPLIQGVEEQICFEYIS